MCNLNFQCHKITRSWVTRSVLLIPSFLQSLRYPLYEKNKFEFFLNYSVFVMFSFNQKQTKFNLFNLLIEKSSFNGYEHNFVYVVGPNLPSEPSHCSTRHWACRLFSPKFLSRNFPQPKKVILSKVQTPVWEQPAPNVYRWVDEDRELWRRGKGP